MRTWNSIGTLATGPIADVSPGGEIAPRGRPVLVETWVRAGNRWVRPGAEPGTRQRRVDGLPVVETSVRAGGADLVLTAYADEGGDRRGRVLQSIENTGAEPVAVAIVAHPATLLGAGRAESIRLTDRLVVVDGRPLLQLPRPPADVAVGPLESLVQHLGDTPVGATDGVSAPAGAAMAVVWPLAAGAAETVALVDGRSRADAPPTPATSVLAGWQAHLHTGAHVALPGWPAHLWPALLSGLLLRVEEATPPLGGSPGRHRDTAVATALALAGLFDAASTEVDRLLDAMTDGSLDRADWALVGVASSRLGLHAHTPVLSRHAASVAAAGGELLAHPLTASARHEVIRAVERAAGRRAAADAAECPPARRVPVSLPDVARLGTELTSSAWTAVAEAATATAPADVSDHAFRMLLGARIGAPVDVVDAVREAAGSTWRWRLGGAGDSPHARAALLIAMRSAAVRELDDGLDVIPGCHPQWFGRNVDVTGLPTTWGRLSFSIRWHAARPALLWELDPIDSGRDLRISATALDPDFRAPLGQGEALLEAPRVETAP